MTDLTLIKNNLSTIQANIIAAAKQYQRDPNTIRLLAVTKGQSAEAIRSAVAAGQNAFGENYLQEALLKKATLSNLALEWHFIGSIQSNKTRDISANFNWVHSVASCKIAKRLHEQRPPHLDPLNICLEVNVNDEPQKSGIRIADLPQLASEIMPLSRLKLRGLMCIPAYTDDLSLQRANFAKMQLALQTLQNQNIPLDTLSMGMSHDYIAAIAEGATIIRIGTAIFGPRSR